ncbi:DMT family transporter [Patescibacteria group bacterium]|nr:DMT family transporter [Patescibacteria group bacterium]
MAFGIVSLLIANLVGGALTPMFIKLGVREIPPITFTAFRFIIAFLITLPLYLKHPGLKITKKNFKWVLIDSVFFTVNVALFSIGIQYTGVVMSQVLYALVPIIVAFLGHFLLKERITKNNAIGSIIAFSGLLFLISQSFSGQPGTFGTPLGNLLIMLAVLSWSCYYIVSRKITHTYSQVSISFANFLTSAIILSALIPFELKIRSFSLADISGLGVISLLVVGIFSSVICINLIQIGIKKIGTFITSLFGYIGPLAAAVTAVPFLGEKITFNLILGGLLIIFGVFYATAYSKLQKTTAIKF